MAASLASTVVAPARRPTAVHAFMLLAVTTISVMVIALAGPTVPAMQRHFADVPGADFLVPMTVPAPLIMMAMLAVAAGALADRFGRKWLIVGAAVLYAAVGSLPLILDSLYAILASRLALGALEAVLVTVSTILIGDYYRGPARARMMAAQGMMGPVASLALNQVGGALGEFGWRTPYGLYLLPLLLAPLMAACLWEPERMAVSLTVDDDAGPARLRPWLLAGLCAIALLMGLAFIVVPVHFGYLYESLGVMSPRRVGIGFSVQSLGGVVGALASVWAVSPRWRPQYPLALMAALCGIGFVLMQRADSEAALGLAGFVNGLGCGMFFPVLLTWTLRSLPASRSGLGIGAVQSCLSLGMFLSPPLVVGLDRLLHGRAAAIGIFGWVLLGAAVMALLTALLTARARHRPARH